MKTVQTEFSKELSILLQKYKKTFASDKNGIFLTDDEIGTVILIGQPETASEDSRDKLFFVSGKYPDPEVPARDEHTTCDGCQMFQDCGCMLDDSCPDCFEHNQWTPKGPIDKEVRSAEECLKPYLVTAGDTNQYEFICVENALRAMHEYASKQIDLRKELIGITRPYYADEETCILNVNEYLKSRPEIKQVTDEMIEKAAKDYENSIGTVRYIKEAKHDFIQGAKAMRDNKIN
jgi:hypothetical protein